MRKVIGYFIRDKIFYGWVIVAASMVTVALLLGITFSFGVFFKPLQDEFNLTRLATSSIFSAFAVSSAAFSLISGWALDKYGPRLVFFLLGLFTGLSLLATSQTNSQWQIFLGYSLLLSMGTAGGVLVPVSAVSRWFDKKRGVAIGITTAGIGLGTLVIVPFAAYLISNLDWRMSYIVLGLVAWLVVIPIAMLLRRDPSEIGTQPDGVELAASGTGLVSRETSAQNTSFSLRQAFRTKSFWLILPSWLLFAFSLNLVVTHLVPYATDVGIPTLTASSVLSVVGGFQILSRLLVGRVSDRIGRKVPGVICATLGAAALLWLTQSHDLWMFYLFAIVFGLSWGGLSVANLTLVSDFFGGRNLGVIMGAVDIGFAAGSAIGPALGGYIFDVTSSYVIAFVIGAVAMLTTALLITFTKRERITEAGVK